MVAVLVTQGRRIDGTWVFNISAEVCLKTGPWNSKMLAVFIGTKPNLSHKSKKMCCWAKD